MIEADEADCETTIERVCVSLGELMLVWYDAGESIAEDAFKNCSLVFSSLKFIKISKNCKFMVLTINVFNRVKASDFVKNRQSTMINHKQHADKNRKVD